ncbi:MAG: MFS transporter, partial [Actinobacteria bacterium]|nr:MFS transporter [Actinomycetota bacterium]
MEQEQIQHNILSRSIKIQTIIIVAIGTFMSALDASIVNISLPNISTYFNVTLTTIEWVILSYLIVISSLLLTYGRLGDLYGHKKIYIMGFIIFTIGSLLCAFSPTILLLVLFRALQAIGAGMLMAMGPAIITINTPPKDRGKFLGTIAVSVSIALAIGPALGGFLTSFFGWQSIFLINVPIGITAFIWAIKSVPITKSYEIQPFDFAGAVFLFLSLVGIVFPLSFADKLGWNNPFIIVSLTAGLIFFILFFITEKRIKHPMLDFSLFKNRIFSMGNFSLLLNFMAQYIVALLVPFYLIQLREMTASEAGLIIIANPIVVIIIAPIAGFLSDRWDTRYLSSIGMLFTSIGLYLLSTLKADSRIFIIIVYAAISGLGIGLFQTPNNNAIMGAVSHNRRGTASSMLATMRNLGMVLGVSLSGILFSMHSNSLNKVLVSKGVSGIGQKNQLVP